MNQHNTHSQRRARGAIVVSIAIVTAVVVACASSSRSSKDMITDESDATNSTSKQSPSGGSESLPKRMPAQLVEDFHSAFGAHHARAVHAKGVILQGSFTPSTEAKSICAASVFDAPVPVVVRFSDFTGIPDIPDTEYNASPRGLALKFLMPDGSNLDVVTHSFNGFPVAKASEFGELLRAIGKSGPGASKPTALDEYLSTHPVAKTFLTTQKPPPVSYATTAFFGVNAFQFTDTGAHGHYVRYKFVPEAGEHVLTAEQLKVKTPNYLIDEIQRRVEAGPVKFTWFAQLAGDGDPIENPSIAWPEGRRLVRLGVVTIDRVGPNTIEADKSLLFMPGTLLPGIQVADPMVTVRNAAYPVSFHERQ